MFFKFEWLFTYLSLRSKGECSSVSCYISAAYESISSIDSKKSTPIKILAQARSNHAINRRSRCSLKVKCYMKPTRLLRRNDVSTIGFLFIALWKRKRHLTGQGLKRLTGSSWNARESQNVMDRNRSHDRSVLAVHAILVSCRYIYLSRRWINVLVRRPT